MKSSYKLGYAWQDEDYVVESRMQIGRRARRTLQSMDHVIDNDETTYTKPLPCKSWEKRMKSAYYETLRKRYEQLETVHRVLAYLPEDMISVIQEKAGMRVEGMPLPKVLHTAK